MVEPVDLGVPPARGVHVVGIGGSGMSAIAHVLARMGHRVSGSDLKEGPGLARARALGADVHVGHAATNVPDGVDLIAISTAVPESNPEVVTARQRGIPVLRRADILAGICATRRTIAVAGTHGKTTTSSMLALVLRDADMHPSFLVGGDLNEIGAGAAWDTGEWLVVEADESDGTFLELGAEAAVVTNVEPDHLEHYGSFDVLVDAFDRFLHGLRGLRVVCADDPVAARLGRSTEATTYGTTADAEFRLVDLTGGRSGSTFELVHGDRRIASITVPVPGDHNARNAAGAVVAGVLLGASPEAAARAMARFGGVARRFQFRGERGGVTFVDDYAHLPGEVAAALAAARSGGWQRVVCVFQPHRYSRTASLWRDFGTAFGGADLLVVTEIYGAGERPRPGVSGRLVADAVTDADPSAAVEWLAHREELVAYLRRTLRPGDVCLTLGAGDITTLPDQMLADG
jgi:UDP-N-acetylmuramate--alanine ligase